MTVREQDDFVCADGQLRETVARKQTWLGLNRTDVNDPMYTKYGCIDDDDLSFWEQGVVGSGMLYDKTFQTVGGWFGIADEDTPIPGSHNLSFQALTTGIISELYRIIHSGFSLIFGQPLYYLLSYVNASLQDIDPMLLPPLAVVGSSGWYVLRENSELVMTDLSLPTWDVIVTMADLTMLDTPAEWDVVVDLTLSPHLIVGWDVLQ